MSYRSHHNALYLENVTLRAENARLREEVQHAQVAYEAARELRDDDDRRRVRGGCLSCHGVILPVAIFAGHRLGAPLPLQLSTARFLDRRGGYTHASLVQARVCTQCGLIHHFLGREVRVAPVPGER